MRWMCAPGVMLHGGGVMELAAVNPGWSHAPGVVRLSRMSL